MNNQNDENNADALRKRLKQAREAMPESDRQRGALLMRARLATWLNLIGEKAAREGAPAPGVVAAFWPLPLEPDMRPLLKQWAEAGLTIALPVVAERNAALQFHRWTPNDAMRPGHYGIDEPVSGQAVHPDVVLVPTLGFTSAGDRLGYGGGYYDRTLAALAAQGAPFIAIGLAWEQGRLPADYAPAAHDVRLDAILTPDGWAGPTPGGVGGKSGVSIMRTRI